MSAIPSAPRTFEAWRQRARRRLPRVVFDFIDGGAEDEVTLRRNRAAFDDLALVPRLLAGIGEISTAAELFGQAVRLPVLPAPAGNARVAGPEGELAQALGASAAGTFSVLSGFSSIPVERIARSVPEPQWMQLYLMRDREANRRLIEKAQELGFSALVLTGDAPVAGNRERDVRNGLTVPLRLTGRLAVSTTLRPRWAWNYLSSAPAADHTGRGLGEAKSHAEYVASVLNPSQGWEDLKWVRETWKGKLLLKGVLCAEDADLALGAGCDGVVVSNHGGRQLDGVPAALEVLPEVVAAVRGRGPVLVDGGIRRGTDVVKALCLGASACLVGRPWLFGLAAGGAAGVRSVLDQFQAEMLRTLRLLGAPSVGDLGPAFIRRRPGSGWERFGS